MGSLWKKESDSVEPLFVNLFTWENDEAKPYEVWEWDKKIQSSDWKHQFPRTIVCHPLTADPVKNSKISDSCLARADGTRRAHFDLKASFRPGLSSAIELYNKCLRFAESDSKNVSLSYANRAICFLHTGKYSECLKDIDLAIAANHPRELLPDLMQLKKKCEEKVEKWKEQKKQPWYGHTYGGHKKPQLSFLSHVKFPCMANVLEIQKNEEFGRYMVATCDIAVGKTVLVEENYMTQLANNYWTESHCYTCFDTTRSFIACPKCTDVMFCSETCQNQNEFHHKFCGANFERMPNHVRLIIKSMLIAISVFTSIDEMMEFVENTLAKRKTQVPEAATDEKSKYALFLNLKGPGGDKFDVETTYKVYYGVLDIPSIKSMFGTEQSQRFLMHLAAEHVSVISSLVVAQRFCYNFHMNRPCISSITSLYSFFNHSCSRNVFNFTVGNKVVCIAIRPIKKGEQLFVKYLDNYDSRTKPYSTKRRQEILLKYCGFLCKCDKCEPSCKPKYSEKMKSDENYQFLLCANANYYERINERAKWKSKCIEFLEKYSHFPWSKEIELVSNIYSRCMYDDYPKAIGYY